MHSTFRLWVFFSLFLTLSFLFMAIVVFITPTSHDPHGLTLAQKIFLGTFGTIATGLMLLGEFRLNMTRITIGDSFLRVRRFAGLGSAHTYFYSDLSGFTTMQTPARYSLVSTRTPKYEYLYIIQDKKTVAKLSVFYHRNYTALKEALEAHVANLGEEKFSYWKIIREVFS